jgi:hypothetical protein
MFLITRPRLAPTWIDNPVFESLLRQIFEGVDRTFSEGFDGSASDNEERLTGDLLRLLEERAKLIRRTPNLWPPGFGVPQTSFSLEVRNTTVKRSEKKNGSDMAFILRAKVPGRMVRSKAIFVQAKKMNVTVGPSGTTFHFSWDVDTSQLGRIIDASPASYYFLYGPAFERTNIRVIPAKSLRGIISSTNATSSVRAHEVMPSSRSFSEFLLDEFIGCWAGDETAEAIRKAEGEDVEFPVRHIIRMNFSSEQDYVPNVSNVG